MSFSLYLSNLSSEQISFGYSAAHESLIALHVFTDCKHHPLHIPWVINARKKVSPALKQEIEAFSIFYKRPIVSFWNLEEDSYIRPFEHDLSQISKESCHTFGNRLVETILHRPGADIFNHRTLQLELIEVVEERYPESKELVLTLFEKPEEIQQRFIDMLEAFWKACLKEEWDEIEERFLKDIAVRGKKLMDEGPLHLLASLSKEINIYPNEKRAVIRRISKKDIHFDETDTLFLTPTYFAWPHLFVNSNKPVGINYSVMENQQEAAQPMPPEDLLKFFRAMGDFTRLQMIKYLSQKPRSTRELAGLIGVTEGAISKHIKQLSDAGLVASKRQSYYVFYHLVEKTLHDFPLGLVDFVNGE